jgi:cytochrome c553
MIGRGLRAVHAVVALLSMVLASAALGADNPVNGQNLFASNPVKACTDCHGTVENRRAAIDPNGDLDFDLVYATFLNAIATQSGMSAFNAGLSTQQKRDIAAYIADVPKARPSIVDFTTSNPNVESSVTTITFSNAVTAAGALTLTSVGLTGSSADFLIKPGGTTCSNNTMLAAGTSCNVNVSFMTSTSSTKVAYLNFPYTQGAQSVTRTAQLTGTVGNQTPPSSATPSGGGGALSFVWIASLLAALALRRRVI